MHRAMRPIFAAVLLAAAGRAQSSFTACHEEGDAAAALSGAAAEVRSPLFDFDGRFAGLRNLMEQRPDDVFVNRAFIGALMGYNKQPLYEQAVVPRYEALYRRNPEEPARAYFYALSILWRDRKNAVAILQSLEGPWPQLALARFRPRAEKAQAEANLAKFAELCPDSLDGEALNEIANNGSEALRKETAARLREKLPGRVDIEALQAWPVLWEMEFQLTPAVSHAELRKRIAEDAAKLGRLNAPADVRLDAVRQGYALAQDSAGERWAREELMRVAPLSRAAAAATVEHWGDADPYPQSRETEAVREWARRRLAAGESWAERWPGFEAAWLPRVTALLSIPDLAPQKVGALGKSVIQCIERNPDFTFGFTDPPLLEVAETLGNAGVELPAAKHAVALGLKQSQQRLAADLAAAGGPMGEAGIRRNTIIEQWMARRIRITIDVRERHAGEAQAELESYRKEVAAETDRLTLWRGLTGLVTAAIAADRKSVAREAITRMGALLAEDPHSSVPREEVQRALRESDYWKSRAALAEAEHRSPDAAAYFRRAAEAAPGDYSPRTRSFLMAEARRVWQAMGGTPEGFEAYSGGTGAPASRWVAKGQAMPAFSLQDLDGRRVRLEDLAGKTVFINVWATWCGPCQAEMPQVQRIYDQLKDRADVRVLSFNIDENPGLASQYMKQHAYTFPALLAREYVDERMSVDGIPRNWIVDARGVLQLERQAGADESFVADVLAAIGRISGK